MNSNLCAESDNVTHLPLFDDFYNKAENALKNNPGRDSYVLVSTDISNFKYINRLYGYEKANELLQNVAAVLTQDMELNVISCRTHSDHFISMYKYKGTHKDFTSLIEMYSRNFINSNARMYKSVTLHLNNGIYFIGDASENLNYSIDKANIARRAIKGNYCVTSMMFTDDMMCRQEEDAKIIALFDNAIKRDRIRIFYQPKMDIVTHRIYGAEALSRIVDENDKIVPPDVFVPVLENTGKIIELDKYVMRRVFSTIADWIEKGYEPVPVSINLSRMDFSEKNIADNIYREFCNYRIPACYIEFELTESLFFAESDVIIKEVDKLRNYGFRVSMDDFGVGYSNLNSLGILPVDVIKFDRGFVKNSIANEASYQIMLSLIGVLKKINYDIVCEGIETRSDEKMIFECGCDTAQGFLYDKPIPLDVFEEKYIR
ncbi:MAG: EAL domain-containing protein [Butyrivibrio sp.]